MAKETTNPEFHLGFLTVLDIEGFGFCGGLLVVNPLGRPIEFHCTAPVRANRTQEILYGKSLKSFLYCDQIGKTLIDQAKSPIDIIVTDQPLLLDVETGLNQLLVLVADKSDSDLVSPHRDTLRSVPLHEETVFKAFIVEASSSQVEMASNCLQRFSLTLPLDEPFERIEHAIDEAQAVAR